MNLRHWKIELWNTWNFSFIFMTQSPLFSVFFFCCWWQTNDDDVAAAKKDDIIFSRKGGSRLGDENSTHPFVDHSQSICFQRKHTLILWLLCMSLCIVQAMYICFVVCTVWPIWFEMFHRKVLWQEDVTFVFIVRIVQTQQTNKKLSEKTNSVRIIID